MNSPFLFGKVISGTRFVNREAEQKRLSGNIASGINTVLISPRRWGKSSLVKQVSETFEKKKNYRFCFIDLFNIRSEEDFYKEYARQAIKSTSSKLDEWMQTAKRFLHRLTPKLSFDMQDAPDIKFELSLKELRTSAVELLNLTEKIGKSKKINVVVCIDEFQNVEYFKDPVAFQKQLRAQWQHHKNVTYILYGSKRHMLMNLFEKASMPFYRFGDVMYIDKISQEHWIKNIVQGFKKTHKLISVDFASKITETVKLHPFYVQQLSHIVWHNCTKEVTEKLFNKSVDDLLMSGSITFQKDFDSLSNAQVNFLKVLKDGIRINFSSAEVIQRYNLGSSANVIRIIKALESKEIIDRFGSTIEFMDPVFELWINKIM